MKKLLLISISFLLVGCVDPMRMVEPVPAKKVVKVKAKKVSKVKKVKPVRYNIPKKKPYEYFEVMKNIGLDTKQDKKYKRMNLATKDKKEWFRDLTYLLWDRQITKSKFIKEGLKRYPGHKYEFEFIIKGMRKYHK